jgi:4-hydroxy-4-methyl-2-oxoglutarate aldolase
VKGIAMSSTPLGVVHRTIARADRVLVDRLAGFGVATIHEAMGRSGLLQPYMRPIYAGARLCGPAVTVLLQPGDNWMLHVAVEQVQAGDVVVAACTTESDAGFFGELLATSFRARGARGLVIDGGVRDVKDLTAMQFPVWSRAISARGTVKATLGSVNIPVICAGALVTPGDVVVADDDGVMVVPRGDVPRALTASRARLDKEAASRAAFQDGELGLDRYGLRAKLPDFGIEYVPYETWVEER